MKSRILYPAGLGFCLAVLALSAGGQTASANASQATVAAGKTTTAGTTHEHHARAHHRRHAKHEHMMMGSAGGGRETGYRAALKHCVAGPAAQRDVCLDAAIERFGRR